MRGGREVKRATVPGVSIYKPRRRRGRNHKYLISYKDADGRVRVKTASTDWKISVQYAMQISQRLDRKRLGLLTDRDERLADRAATPLLKLLDEFTTLRRASGITEKECGSVHSRCLWLFERMDADALADFTADGVRLAVAALRDGQKASLRTCNLYVKAAKSFARWLDRHAGRHDDIRWIEAFYEATDVRHGRRALSDAEVDRLLGAARSASNYLKISGIERELVYMLACTSGLRANELRTLRREDFQLDGNPPLVLVRAVNAKNRKDARQPLRRDVAARFSAFLADKPYGEPIWRLPDKPVKMLLADFEAAGITYETHDGFADFHSLRHTYGTRLGKSGASIKVVQRLMRHSDVRLTLRYMHAALADDVAAIEGLAALGDAAPEQQRATGTDGGIQFPFQYAAKAGVFNRLDIMGRSVGRRPPKPKVAGSTPAGNDSPSLESASGNTQSVDDSSTPLKPVSVAGAAPDSSTEPAAASDAPKGGAA